MVLVRSSTSCCGSTLVSSRSVFACSSIMLSSTPSRGLASLPASLRISSTPLSVVAFCICITSPIVVSLLTMLKKKRGPHSGPLQVSVRINDVTAVAEHPQTLIAIGLVVHAGAHWDELCAGLKQAHRRPHVAQQDVDLIAGESVARADQAAVRVVDHGRLPSSPIAAFTVAVTG